MSQQYELFVRPTIYVSGPISIGDFETNVDLGVDTAEVLRGRGYLPFVPHILSRWGERHGFGYEDYMNYDLDWVGRCDNLYRIPGESPGADREVELAQNLGKTVFFDMLDVPILGGAN